MKYVEQIEIDRPRADVVALFADPENMKKWVRDIEQVEHISGKKGTEGARTRLIMSGRAGRSMIETITDQSLPDRYAATYETKGVHNRAVNYFHEVGPERTKWIAENEFRFRGIMKVVGLLFRPMFPKETRKHMKAFKAFAEGQPAARPVDEAPVTSGEPAKPTGPMPSERQSEPRKPNSPMPGEQSTAEPGVKPSSGARMTERTEDKKEKKE